MRKQTVSIVAGMTALCAPALAFGAETSSAPLTRKGAVPVPKMPVVDTSQVAVQNDIRVNTAKPVTAPQDTFAAVSGKKVGRIRVEGLQNVSKDLIVEAIRQKEGDIVTEDAVRKDLVTIYNIGFFRDVQPTFRLIEGKGEKVAEITYHIAENPKIKTVEIQGGSLLNKMQMTKFFQSRPGDVPNMKTIVSNLRTIEKEYKEKGYVLAEVKDARITPDGTLIVVMSEGKISNFKFTGQKKTKEHVLAREMRQKPGEPFNQKLAQRSCQRIYNLGYFEDVNMKLNPGPDPDTVEVEVMVEEANAATVGIGAGYSQSNGFTGQLTFTDKNFLGNGDNLGIRWEFGGPNSKNYDLSYTKPWLDHKETTMSVNIYDSTSEYSESDKDGREVARYDKQRIGQEITFSRADSEYTRNYLTLKRREDKYKGSKNGPGYYEEGYKGETNGKSVEERKAENFGETRSIVFTRTYDSRDNIYDPHKGKRNSYSFELGGFGGDFSFRKLATDHRYYWELGKRKHVLALDIASGIAWGDMPLSQRFSVGGADTLRGYEDDQFKGDSMLRASLEYRIPIAKKIQAVAFLDEGYAWDSRTENRFNLGDLKTGVGVGLRLQTPIGPVRLDYGIGDEKKLHFSFNATF